MNDGDRVGAGGAAATRGWADTVGLLCGVEHGFAARAEHTLE